jgi:hypothetical protein
MALELGWIGEEMNVTIRQGATVGPYHATMVNPDSSPVNLAGCTIVGEIRKKPHDSTIVLNWRVQITDAINGKYDFWLTDEDTTPLECGDTLNSSKSQYVHDIELHDAAGQVIPLYYGKVAVFREVTR